MAILTVEIPDDLLEQLNPIRHQIPDLLRQCIRPLTLPIQSYRYILEFLVSQPTPEQVVAFRPAPEMQKRLQYLLAQNVEQTLTLAESQELDEYEQIEHLIVLLKSGSLPYLVASTQT